jgi:hypothetical protein
MQACRVTGKRERMMMLLGKYRLRLSGVALGGVVVACLPLDPRFAG